jgi:hypothetical protein
MLAEHRYAASDPTTTAMVHRSEAALKAGRRDEAEQLARAAIARDDRYVPARLALGRALESLGKHGEAASVYAEAARMSPFSAGVSGSLRRVWIAPLTGFGIVAGVLWAVFRIVGRQFDQRTVLVGLLVSTAVLVAGTLVMLQRRRRRFAGLSADDRRVLEAHGRGALLAGQSSGRLLAVAFVILLLSAAAVVFAVGTKPSLGMKVGDCFTLDKQTSIEQVSAIPCALPHGTEIYAVIVDPAPVDAPFPGIDAVRAAAKPGCEAAYERFIGAPYTTASRYWMNILSPEEPYWVIGIRTNWCAVYDRNGHQTTGSAKGSGS